MRARFILAVGLTVALCLTLVLTSGGLTSADSGTIWVNADAPATPTGTSCDQPRFNRIQDAVNAAAPGDRINVCPATYPEQVIIGPGKDNIQLRSVKVWAAVIKAPATIALDAVNFKAIVRVSSSQNVTLLAFTITGPGPAGCDSIRYGVRVDMAGSANILGNHITQIHDTPFSGCQNGVAVLAGRAAEGTTGSARIIGNLIDNYQKNGPTISNVGSSGEVSNNRIFGSGPTAVIAQNGIQISGGATGSIRHNFVANNIFTPQFVVSTGVLVFDSGLVTMDHNTITANDVGDFMIFANPGSTATHNRVRASTFDGIALDVANGNQVNTNRSEQNGGPGISLYDDSENNAVGANKVEDNTDSGILVDNGSNNTISNNQVRGNGSNVNGPDSTDGIRVNLLSTGNTIQNNHLRDNITHDCHDNSTGNMWINNHGETSQPPGLCGRDPNDADFSSIDAGWDPNFAWYLGFDGAADYDWVATYAAIDTDSILLLLPQVQLHPRSASLPFE